MANTTTKSAAKKTSRAPRTKKTAAVEQLPLTVNMEGAGLTESDNAELAGLLADLALDTPAIVAADPDVVIEPPMPAEDIAAITAADIEAALAPTVVIEPTEADINAAVAGATVAEHYAEIEGDAPASEADTPSADAPVEVKGKKEKAPKEKKERLHFSDKVERIKHRLGDKLGDFLVLEMNDALLEGDALAQKQDETMAILKGMNVKEKNRASLLLDYAAGKSGKLNEVMHRAINVLNADGKLTTGDNGNLHKNLLARPYSAGAARSMGRNTINVFADLKIVKMVGKGEFVVNPDSLLLATINSKIAAPAAPVEAAAPVITPVEVEAAAVPETTEAPVAGEPVALAA